MSDHQPERNSGDDNGRTPDTKDPGRRVVVKGLKSQIGPIMSAIVTASAAAIVTEEVTHGILAGILALVVTLIVVIASVLLISWLVASFPDPVPFWAGVARHIKRHIGQRRYKSRAGLAALASAAVVALAVLAVILLIAPTHGPPPRASLTPAPSRSGIQSVLVHDGEAQGTTATLQPTRAGDALIIVAMPYGTGPGQQVTKATLGKVPLKKLAHAEGDDDYVSIWADFHCAAGQKWVTISTTSTKALDSEIYYYEFSGVSNLDQYMTGETGGTSTTFSSGTTQETRFSDEAWVGGVSNTGGNIYPDTQWHSVSNGGYFASGYQITARTGQAVYSGTQGAGYSVAAVVTLAGL